MPDPSATLFHRPAGRPLEVIVVVGARPNYPKVAPLCHAFDQHPERLRYRLVDTGQHYDRNLAGIFAEAFGLRTPDIAFGKTTGTHAQQTAAVLTRFEEVLQADRPDLVMVVGDVNSTLACALAAVKLHIAVAHVEAGLRSFDRTMPEEVNRVVVDQVADLLFTTEPSATENLQREGVAPDRIYPVGNVMIDTLLAHKDRALALDMPRRLGLPPQGYALVTLHRPRTTDDPARLAAAIAVLQDTAARLPVVLPLHPRTKKALERDDLFESFAATPGLHLLEPQGYLEFLGLQAGARAVLTDSGGIQEETTVLGIPCLTLRPHTERPVTCSVGTNKLVDLDRKVIAGHLETILAGRWKVGAIPEGWDGRAAKRIATVLVEA